MPWSLHPLWLFSLLGQRGNNLDLFSLNEEMISPWTDLAQNGSTGTYLLSYCFIFQRCLSLGGNCLLRAEMISALTKSKGKLFPR
jgi:hypothetical protein